MSKLYSDLSSLKKHLKDILEAETRTQSIADGMYTGTASEIVQTLNKEEKLYSWFKDSIAYNECCPYNNDQAIQILHLIQEKWAVKKDNSDDLDVVSDVEELKSLDISSLEVLLKKLKLLCDAQEEAKNLNYSSSNYTSISAALINEIKQVIENVRNSYAFSFDALEQIADNEQYANCGFADFPTRIVEAFSSMNNNDLEYAIKVLSETFNNINIDFAELEISIPKTRNPNNVLTDVNTLLNYIEGGKSLSAWKIFLPKKITSCFYIFAEITNNGQLCRKSEEDLAQIALYCKNIISLTEAKKFLSKFIDIDDALPIARQVVDVKRTLKYVKDIYNIVSKREIYNNLVQNCRTQFKKIDDICKNYIPIHISASSIAEIKNSISNIEEAYKGLCVLQKIREYYKDYCAFIDKSNISNKNFFYMHTKSEILDQVNVIYKYAEKNKKYMCIHDFSEKLPNLFHDIVQDYDNPIWQKRLSAFNEAWAYARARSWVHDYILKGNVDDIQREIRQNEIEISKTIHKLTAQKAWSECMKRVTAKSKESIIKFAKSIKSFGKGTGKYAQKYQNDARRYLKEASTAVPAWIMPVNHVWNNISTENEMFDIVIVDEASQCNVECSMLGYFGKKMIIVGDDEQISPSNIGALIDSTEQILSSHLSGYLKERFDIKNSLFDVANQTFVNSKVALREHFRCMPEIIQFSNELCYAGTPLIPMKQFGEDRLPPLEHYFCDGYREKKVNIEEVNAVVNKIKEICKDPRYINKSIGVISLLGQEQAGLIANQLLENIGIAEITKRNIVCGNAYDFQGDERDIIILSMVIANFEKDGNDLVERKNKALTDNGQKQRFNVAMSRVKEQVILFHSVEAHDLSPQCLRRRLLEFFEHKVVAKAGEYTLQQLQTLRALRNEAQRTPFESWFEVDVAIEILKRGYKIQPQYAVADWRIDLVVIGNSSKLAVECDGDYWHGEEQYDDDIRRQQQLERCGWEFFRVKSSTFYYNRELAMQKLWMMLENRKIFPVS